MFKLTAIAAGVVLGLLGLAVVGIVRRDRESEHEVDKPAIGEARRVEPSRQVIVRRSAQDGRGNLINHEPVNFPILKGV